ncbi:MAG: hypothetical protein KDD45_17495, partial [Bdellovibrionales bacterium]|nr:hypothetical protein [Bdellovibrionales bacterium]
LTLSLQFFAQEKIVVLINSNGTFIETYEKQKTDYSEYTIQSQSKRLGPAASKSLKEGLSTALKWIDLNKVHKKSFEKEICRFKAMDKEAWEMMGFQNSFASEMSMLFIGNNDGTFILRIGNTIMVNSYFGNFLTFKDESRLKKFLGMLNGNSPDKEIDDIFKR